MTSPRQHRNWIFKAGRRTALATLAFVVVLAFTLGLTPAAQAQTFNLVNTFTGGLDGASPASGVTMDRAAGSMGQPSTVAASISDRSIN